MKLQPIFWYAMRLRAKLLYNYRTSTTLPNQLHCKLNYMADRILMVYTTLMLALLHPVPPWDVWHSYFNWAPEQRPWDEWRCCFYSALRCWRSCTQCLPEMSGTPTPIEPLNSAPETNGAAVSIAPWDVGAPASMALSRC